MAREKEMKKYAFNMPKDLISRMDNTIKEIGGMPRAEFVRQAVEYYISYNRLSEFDRIVSPYLASSIKGELQTFENIICEMLFKLAVQSGVTNTLIANHYKLNPSAVRYTTELVEEQVKMMNGIIDLEDAILTRNASR